MPRRSTVDEGYYWFRSQAFGRPFIMLLEPDGLWYIPGIMRDVIISDYELIGPVAEPEDPPQ